jgi:glutamate/tyrosine decarboxylase-like PLP-dependent enzyme
VEIWAALRSLGRRGLANLIERTGRHARRFAEGLAAAGYQVLNDVVLNQVPVSFGNAETTNRVIAANQADGTCCVAGLSSRGGRPCESVSRHGQRLARMSSVVWWRCCGSPRNTAPSTANRL